ncbi:MAG: matrixin family metalloprotease [Acidimicrobiia bacterium]
MTILLVTPALATNVLGHRANWAGSTIVFAHVNLESAMHNASSWNEVNNLAPTDIVRSHYNSWQPTGINMYDSNYGDTTWVARWYCSYWYGGSKCLLGTIQYNLEKFNESNTNYARGIACHEQGHGVGLAHTTDPTSCMQNPATQDDYNYSPHDIIHINSLY